MDYLFNEKSYPVVVHPDGILEELNRDGTKAVIFRDKQKWQEDSKIFKSGIIIPDDKVHAQKYWRDTAATEHGRKITGDRIYTDLAGSDAILLEACNAHIDIKPQALELLAQRVSEYRALFQRVQEGYRGFAKDDELHTRVLFAPKGGQGRSPMMHVDDVDLTMHFTVSGAAIRVSNGVITETAWEAMNRDLMRTMPENIRVAKEEWLTDITAQYVEEFSTVSLGDVVIMKGGKDKDLRIEKSRDNTCVHVSSPYIQQEGQAAVLFYAKNCSTSLE